MTFSIGTGDIVRMKPKYYGPDQEDQWEGITGIVLELIEADGSNPGASILVQHPDDSNPVPIFAFLNDVEKVVDSEYCDVCECTPCDCGWGN